LTETHENWAVPQTEKRWERKESSDGRYSQKSVTQGVGEVKVNMREAGLPEPVQKKADADI